MTARTHIASFGMLAFAVGVIIRSFTVAPLDPCLIGDPPGRRRERPLWMGTPGRPSEGAC